MLPRLARTLRTSRHTRVAAARTFRSYSSLTSFSSKTRFPRRSLGAAVRLGSCRHAPHPPSTMRFASTSAGGSTFPPPVPRDLDKPPVPVRVPDQAPNTPEDVSAVAAMTLSDWAASHPLMAGTVGTVVTGGLLAGLWAATHYIVCKPNQFVVRTGLFIEDMQVDKSAVLLPFQRALIVDVNPVTYSFRLHNMSKGKVEFELPVVMTIGPMTSDPDAFKTYCRLLQDMDPDEIEHTVKGIIEGETRGLTAQMTVEEMFNGKDVFREVVLEKLGPDLRELGLRIYNANIQEMKDYDEANKYFEYRKKRAIEMANNEAREDVAKARRQGDVAVSLQERDTRIAVARNEKEATVEEYESRRSILEAETLVAQQEADTQQAREVAMMRAQQQVRIKEQELQEEIEALRYKQAMQHERANRVAPALAEAESMERVAEAKLFQATKEAEGIEKLMSAQASGVERLLESCQGNPELAKFYLGNEARLWHTVAEQSAQAVRDMKPTITNWTTGKDPNGGSAALVDLVQNVVPLYKEVSKKLKD